MFSPIWARNWRCSSTGSTRTGTGAGHRSASGPGSVATATATHRSRPGRRVLELQHDHGLRRLIEAVERLAEDLSVSDGTWRVSPELVASLEQDRELLPLTWQRFHGLNAHEPYRLKLAYIHSRLGATRKRILEGARHQPGVDYAGHPGLPPSWSCCRPRSARTPVA